jgi:hypothetical protein
MSDTTQPEAAPAPAQAGAPARETVNALIDRWFVDHFHGSPVATVTEHFNLVQQAVEDLKRRLEKEI